VRWWVGLEGWVVVGVAGRDRVGVDDGRGPGVDVVGPGCGDAVFVPPAGFLAVGVEAPVEPLTFGGVGDGVFQGDEHGVRGPFTSGVGHFMRAWPTR